MSYRGFYSHTLYLKRGGNKVKKKETPKRRQFWPFRTMYILTTKTPKLRVETIEGGTIQGLYLPPDEHVT